MSTEKQEKEPLQSVNELTEEQVTPAVYTANAENVSEDKTETEPEDNTQNIVPFAGAGGGMMAGPPQPEVPTDDDRFIKFGGIFLLATLGLFSIWAGFAPLSSAVVSAGEVVVNSHRKSIQHFEGGVVKQIFVRNGDVVAEGDPLIQLQATQAGAQQDTNMKRLYTAQAQVERLIAEQSFQKTLAFSTELITKAKTALEIENVLSRQNQLFDARMRAYFQERDALNTRIEQTREHISGLSQQRDLTKEQIISLDEEQKAHSTLFEEGLGDGLRARELERIVLSKKNEAAKTKSEIARLKIQITETELQIATRKQDFLKDVGERLKNAQDDYYAFKEGLEITADKVERSTIRAPEAGIVVDMKIHTIGSVAPSGQTLLDLVPEHDTYVVETQLQPQDINEVYAGQKADIRFSAFNAKTTMVIEGEVINVSADRLINQQSGNPYYLARIRITAQGAEDLSPNKLKPGMPAEVMIIRSDRTLFSYLIKPLSDSFARSLREK